MPRATPTPRCKRCATTPKFTPTSTRNMQAQHNEDTAMSETITHHIKPPVAESTLEYKNLKQGEFWRHIPAYKDVDEARFLDHLWQQKNAVKTADELLSTIKDVCSPEFYKDAADGFGQA